MTTPQKIDELHAVVNFWKYRVEENKRQLRTLLGRLAAEPKGDACGQSFMTTLVDMKTRELSESQRGLRKAQAGLGRALEAAGMAPMDVETQGDPVDGAAVPASLLETLPLHDRFGDTVRRPSA